MLLAELQKSNDLKVSKGSYNRPIDEKQLEIMRQRKMKVEELARRRREAKLKARQDAREARAIRLRIKWQNQTTNTL